MKKVYLSFLIALFAASGSYAQQMWDNFEDTRKATYGFINGVFIPYTQNPAPNGINASQVVATYVRNPAEQFDVLIALGEMADVSDYVSGAKQMTMDVWSPAAGITIQITLENAAAADGAPFPTGRHSIYQATTQVAGNWHTVTFNFTELLDGGVANDDVTSLVLLFNVDSFTDDTYFWDNLNGPELASDPCEGIATNEAVLQDYECQQNINHIAATNIATLRRVQNPDQNGNESSFVGTYVRSAAADDNIVSRTDGPLQLTPESTTITMDIWDPTAPTNVIFSLQNINGDVIQEMVASTTNSSTWETLTFDVAPDVTSAPDIEQITILIDPGSAVTGDQYYFDNIVIPALTSSEDVEFIKDFKVFPNPATNMATINYNLIKAGDVNYTLTDVTGRVVQNELFRNQASGTQQFDVNTGELANGIYLYNLLFNGQSVTGSLVVNH